MSCNEQTRWQAMIIDRLADELSEEDAVLLEQHLGDCESCMREARMLTGVVREASGPVEWRQDPAIEERLLAALHDLPAAAGRSAIEEAAAGPVPRVQRAAPWRGWLAALTGLGLRSLPAYAAAALVLVAAVTGFWAGRGQPGPMVTGSRSIATTWSQSSSDTSRMPARRTTPGQPGAELLLSPPSFAAATPAAPLRATGLGFVSVRSDAVDLPGLMVADSL